MDQAVQIEDDFCKLFVSRYGNWFDTHCGHRYSTVDGIPEGQHCRFCSRLIDCKQPILEFTAEW